MFVLWMFGNTMNFVTEQETLLRLTIFMTVLAVMAMAEHLWPRKDRTQKQAARWITNGGLLIIDTIALRLVLPVFAVGVAIYAQQQQWGLLNTVPLPLWIEIGIAIILLDMLIYAQHVATHKIPILWALHKVHHTDRDIDASTGIRFHPVEIILSMLFKMLCVLAIGPASAAVILFEILLNASALFNHANVRLSGPVDKVLRWVIITPDTHRVHHSIVRDETDSNYGFFLSVWDRIFGTYKAQPDAGHDAMIIGLPDQQTAKPSQLLWSLIFPFRKN